MLVKYLFSIIAISVFCKSQQTTYSKSEEVGFRKLQYAWYAATTYASKQYSLCVIDTFDQFLNTYPNSIFKTGVLNYKLNLASIASSDSKLITSIADSILCYDSLVQTKLGVAEIFIQKNINASRGAYLINEILPELSDPYHRYKAYNLLASYSISKGEYSSAKSYLHLAIGIDSSRFEAWYSYLSLLKSREDINESVKIQKIISKLQYKGLSDFESKSSLGPNVLSTFGSYSFTDINGKSIRLSSFKNKVIVVDCFAFWCDGCVRELPVLHSLCEDYPNVVFIYINMPPDFIGGNPKDTKK